MNSSHFFRQATADQFIGSMAYLDSQQSLFHHDQNSGMIEVQINQAEWVILLFARGISTGIYRLTDESCKPILMSELHAILNNSSAPICTQILPDVAGRLIWLALESQLQKRSQIRNLAEWESLMDDLKTEKLTGLVQVSSEFFDGFVFLQGGKLAKSESIFSSDEGFQPILPFFRYREDIPCQLAIYTSPPTSLARQGFILRRGVSDWITLLLNRYREMVGQRLVEIMINQSNISIEPWQWKIQLEGTSLWDQHFFSNIDAAGKAYRALLMSMTEQCSMMIGNGLTQRLVSETYGQLSSEENEVLESQRLIPAAFA